MRQQSKPGIANTACTISFAVLVAAIALSVGSNNSYGKTAGTTISFGIVPQQSATRLAQVWVPLLNYLGKRTNITIRFATAKDIPTFEECLAKGAYDVAYMNPYHYTTFSRTAGYRAFARQKNKKLKGLIVVRKSDSATNLKDLNGSKIAFPSPAAFGASVIPRAELRAKGVSFTPVYVRSHDSVYRAVSAGIMRAGGGVGRTFGNMPPEIRSKLKVIYRTLGYTPHAFATHPSLAKTAANAIASTLTQLDRTEPQLLKPLGMKAIQLASDSDWDDIRALGLKKAQTKIIMKSQGKCRSG